MIGMAENWAEDLSAVEREGLAWVELLFSGQATPPDLTALGAWRRRGAPQEAAFAAAVRLRRLVQRCEMPSEFDVPAQPLSYMTRRALVGGALAASAAGVAVMRPPFDLWPSLAELTSDYRTSTGQQRLVELAPHLSMELNTQTSVSLDSRPGRPGVQLISGEIAVAVKLESSKLFRVFAGRGCARAYDASFNLRDDSGQVKVTCLAGKVEVVHATQTIRLAEGEMVTYGNDVASAPEVVDTSLVTAWRRGVLTFHSTSLAHVVAEVNRYRPGKIVIVNSDLARRQFSGNFRIDRLEDVIVQIHKVAGATVTEVPGGIVLLS